MISPLWKATILWNILMELLVSHLKFWISVIEYWYLIYDFHNYASDVNVTSDSEFRAKISNFQKYLSCKLSQPASTPWISPVYVNYLHRMVRSNILTPVKSTVGCSWKQTDFLDLNIWLKSRKNSRLDLKFKDPLLLTVEIQ